MDPEESRTSLQQDEDAEREPVVAGADLQRMHRRVKLLERELRILISLRLNEAYHDLAWEHVPGGVRSSVQSRIEARERDHPYQAGQYTTLARRLEFCQFSDYAKIMTPNWHLFRDVWGPDIQRFESIFHSVTTARNALMHDGELLDTDYLMAEGGLVWLERCMKIPPLPEPEPAKGVPAVAKSSAPTGLNARQKAYQKFFAALEEELRRGLPFQIRPFAPRGESWLPVIQIPKTGRPLVMLNCAFTKDRAFRVELKLVSPDRQKNKAAFDRLYAQRDRIETLIGEPLAWERLDDYAPARIEWRHECTFIMDATPADLAALRQWAVAATQRMREVFWEEVRAALQST